MKKIFNYIIVLTLFITRLMFAQDVSYKIIVNKSNPVATLTKTELSKLLLKKTTIWSNNKDVIAVDLPESSPVREKMTIEIHDRNMKALLSYWRLKLFSGRDKPPMIIQNDEDVITFVKETPGAIGYVSSDADVDNVKVVEITGL